ncbi:MAG: proliferating cell nuclear antigen (pcna) [Candidatus Aenigmatarchaeota archaeon]
MFKAVLKDVGLLVNSISTIAELIDEGVFKLAKDGISLMASDRAMVAAVDFKILSSAFEEYEIDKEQSIGLDIPNFLSVLKRASAQDKIIFNLQDSKLEIVFENSSKRRFVLPLLELSQEEVPRIDQLEFTTKAQLDSNVLETGIADAEVTADTIVFEASPSKFVMRAEGDISSNQLELEMGSKALSELKATGSVKARYPLDYLKKMIKAAKLSNFVVLEWAQDYPIKMIFEVKDKLSLNFVLAPRVEEE